MSALPAPAEMLDSLITVLDLVRTGRAKTRPELSRMTSLGRAVVSQRVRELLSSGLIAEDSQARSTGGRPARQLRFRAEAGIILAVEMGATSIAVGTTDLAGKLLASREESADVAAGPETVLDRVEALLDSLLSKGAHKPCQVWGVGAGLPGPVRFVTGRPVAPPIMPGWDGYPVRDRLARRYSAPTWVDNEVNLMALGELRKGLAQGERDVVFLKIGTGIGAGLLSAGVLHRGAQGAAGDVGHVAVCDDTSVICRCGNVGCLEALAGGASLGRLATAAAQDGRSEFLAKRVANGGVKALQASDLVEAAAHGDSFAVEAFERAGHYIGRTLAKLVNFYNPALIILGGGVTNAGDLLLAAVRQAIYSGSSPLATRDLRISRAVLGDNGGLYGAAFAVLDELFSRRHLPQWIADGSPASRPEISEDDVAA
jgi:glucokinase-like ROK family protein